MAPHFEPPTPDTEAVNMLAAYHERLRAAELRDLDEVNLETEPTASSGLNTNRIRRALSRVSRLWRRSDREPAL